MVAVDAKAPGGIPQSDPMNERHELAPFFTPDCLAILGSFRENYFGGFVVVKSLLEAGYAGRIYPVNPGYQTVLGTTVYPSLESLPEVPDLVLIMINARAVPAVLESCGDKGVRAVVVVADGFAERDRDGALLQEEILSIARDRRIRIIGPNTAGLVNPAAGFNPCPYDAGYYRLKPGPIAVCSQTGMINPQAFPYLDLTFGVSKICDLGNKSDVDECDLLPYLGEDEQTGVISLYVESVRDGRRFMQAAREVTPKKPVLVLKLGRTEAGAKASASHTGSMAVDDRIFEAAARQAGLLRLDTFRELFEIPKIFASQPLPNGNRLAIMSYTGGIGVLATDESPRYGLQPARASQDTRAALEDLFPGLGTIPIDLGPMMAAVKDHFALYPSILRTLVKDEGVDALFNVLWTGAGEDKLRWYLEAYESIRDSCSTPIATWIYGPRSPLNRELARRVEGLGFPVFEEPETCIKALGLAYQYTRVQARKRVR